MYARTYKYIGRRCDEEGKTIKARFPDKMGHF